MENQRRTGYIPACNQPVWNQTVSYPNLDLQDLKKKYLEISVWSFNLDQLDSFLGQINIHLSGKCLSLSFVNQFLLLICILNIFNYTSLQNNKNIPRTMCEYFY